MAKLGRHWRNVSVSSGTLRTEDLFHAFIPVLRAAAPKRADNFAAEWELPGGTEESNADIVDELFNALDDIAPEGTYFGTLEGDGAEFGFWEISADDEV